MKEREKRPGKLILSGSMMIFLSKYQDNQPAEPAI